MTRARGLFAGLFFIGWGWLLYASSLRVPFLYDDLDLIVGNSNIRTLWPLSETINTIRPLVDITYALNFHFGGLDLFGYHLVNILVHIAATAVLYGVVRRVLVMPGCAERFGEDASMLAFCVATLWLSHPLNTESVTYIAQRAESLAGFFYLLTLYGFIRSAGDGEREKVWQYVSIAACALGMMTKITIVTAPLFVCLFDRLFVSGSWRSIFKKRGEYYAWLFSTYLILVLATAMPFYLGWYKIIHTGSEVTPLIYLENQCAIILRYLRLAFVPASLCIDYAYAMRPHRELLLPCLTVFAAAASVILGTARGFRSAVLGVWFFLILVPTSSVFPVFDAMAERRMYLPLISVLITVVLAIYGALGLAYRGQARWPRLIFILFVFGAALFLGQRTILRNVEYLDQYRFWNEAIRTNPENLRAYSLAGAELIRRGQMNEAMALLSKGIELNPEARAALSESTEQSEALFPPPLEKLSEQAMSRRYFGASTLALLGVCFDLQGDEKSALRHFRASLKMFPWKTDFYLNLGAFMARHENWVEAEKYYRHVLALDSKNMAALEGLKALATYQAVSPVQP